MPLAKAANGKRTAIGAWQSLDEKTSLNQFKVIIRKLY
jgi:hypothetical protein